MGYLNDREKTDEAIDMEGWLHSGDLGRIDNKGFLHLMGRKKVMFHKRIIRKKILISIVNYRKYW